MRGADVLWPGEIAKILEECYNKIVKIIIIKCSPADLSSSAHLLFTFLHLKPGVVMSCAK